MRVAPGVSLAELNAALAIDDVLLDADSYVFDTPPSVPRRPMALINVGNRKLIGAGAGQTIIRFTGDVGGRDWWGMEIASGSIQGLTADTSGVTGAIEQMHVIRGNGGAIEPEIAYCEFIHPHGGDGIQFVGYPTSRVIRPWVHHCDFLLCARSGVAAHSGVHGLRIEACDFHDVGGQDIDAEGSGDHRDWWIDGCRFGLGAGSRSSFGIQLHLIDGATFANCQMSGRGIFVLSGRNVLIDRCRIYQTVATGGVGVLEIDKASDDCSITNSTIVRAAEAGPGPVIRTLHRDGVTPNRLRVTDSTLVQNTGSDIVSVSGANGFTVEGSTLVGITRYGVLAQGAPGLKCDEVDVRGCTFSGPLYGCVATSGSYGGAGAFRLTDNHAFGAANGIVVGSRFTGTIEAEGNYWPAPQGWSPP